MRKETVICWFRQDLRVADNPALAEAAKRGVVLPLYILDDACAGVHAMGGASRWWLHHSLKSLSQSLEGKLALYSGDAREILTSLVAQYAVKAVYWNRCYEPWRIARDKEIKEMLKTHNKEVMSYNGSLLWEPWDIRKGDGTPYRMFTPFYRRGCLHAEPPRHPLSKPRQLQLAKVPADSLSLQDLDLLPKIPWDKQLEPHWYIGEEGAKKRLRTFLKKGLSGYREGRDYPAVENVSRLSPHLHFGEISPHQVWHAAKKKGEHKDADHFLNELGWREFSYSLLYHFPDLPRKNWQAKFDAFPWEKDEEALKRWQKGQTGYPLVDAGMRQLWQTGYMHNRVRMIVGSFLVKNLLLHWHEGEKWFWDCLVDADLANNSASWQWVAGCGADAAPYFRIFNPVTQGQKFDPHGEYTRQFVPELQDLPEKYLFCPWEAPEKVLDQANITLGVTYPKPLVNVKASRERALRAFHFLKES